MRRAGIPPRPPPPRKTLEEIISEVYRTAPPDPLEQFIRASLLKSPPRDPVYEAIRRGIETAHRARNDEPVSELVKKLVSVRDGWRCTYCRRPVTRETRHIDHAVSRAHGGSNDPHNLRLSCAPCNLRKGASSFPLPLPPPFRP